MNSPLQFPCASSSVEKAKALLRNAGPVALFSAAAPLTSSAAITLFIPEGNNEGEFVYWDPASDSSVIGWSNLSETHPLGMRSCGVSLYTFDSGEIEWLSTGISGSPNLLDGGDPIGPGGVYLSGSWARDQNDEVAYGPVENGLLGYRITSGVDVAYGWVRFDNPGSMGGTVTLHEWAYEDSGMGLSAGQIPEPAVSGLLLGFGVLAVLGLRRLQRRPARKN